MPALPYSAFSRAKAIPKAGAHRVYGTMGDGFLQQGVTASLLEWLLDNDARDFNLDTLDGESATVAEIAAHCGNLPFLSERRVVIVRRAERLENMHRTGEDKAESKADKGKLSPAKRLIEAMKSLPASTTLILSRTPETPEPGARKDTARCINATVDKAIESTDCGGILIDCTVGAKSGGVAIAAVNNEAARRDIPLDDGVASYLVARAGTDIALLLNELEKCALRAGLGEVVTKHIIDEMTPRLPQETIFDLMDALGARNAPHALGLLRELLSGGAAPEMVLSMMVKHLRQLLQARAMLDARVAIDASAATRMPPALAAQLPRDGRENLATILQSQGWRGSRLAQQARGFSTTQLCEAMGAALEADLAIKGIEGDGGGDSKTLPPMLLELFIARMC